MLYEKESPPVSSLPSPRWNTRSQSNRVRTFLVLGIIALFLVTLALIGHYSGVSRVPSSPSLHSLKNPNLLNPLRQQDRFGSVRKPPVKSSEDEYDDDDFVVNDGMPPKQSPTPDSIPPTQNPNEPILANSTLDFGKIYVLNLETREDRRDEMTFIAAASGLQLSFVPGVNSKTLETQSLPDSYAVPGVILEPAHLACYRGHANIWRKIVEEGVQTALILEDDIDWDLTIRESIPRLKEGLAKITGDPDPWRNTPAWDIFYLGTCYEEAFDPEEYDPEKADEVFVDIPSDKETLDVEIYAWVDTIYEKYYNDTVPRRLIVKGKNPVCTHGYALTNRGARKLLLEMNEWLPFPVDITMIHYISEGRFKAYSVMPPLFVQWRNTHDPRKNSDIEGSGIELARNWGFWRSARKHLVDWVTSGATGYRWWDGLPRRTD